MRVIIALFGLCVLVSSVCAEEIPAPLGMKWGDSEEIITKSYGGVKNTPNNGLEVYAISNPPLKLDGIDRVIGLVYPSIGLVKVILVKDIIDDAYGITGKELYDYYKGKLTEKYGKPKSYEYSGRKVFTESDEFYQCLKHEGCGSMISFFTQKDGGSMSIELIGDSRGSGRLRMDYESKGFVDAQDEMQKIKSKKDSAGL